MNSGLFRAAAFPRVTSPALPPLPLYRTADVTLIQKSSFRYGTCVTTFFVTVVVTETSAGIFNEPV
jgi:hypothetical protein